MLDPWLEDKLNERRTKQLLRKLTTRHNLIDFTSNDYLGLAGSTELFKTIEHEAKQVDAATRAALRHEKSRPRLEALKAWLDRERIQVVPKTPIADAINYTLNQWSALTSYITDGDLAIDNNAAERAIKPFAIGRKNWLFFGSDHGGQTLATLASFTATCELFKLNPWLWLRDTLTRLPLTPTDQLYTLLPTADK